MDLRCECERDWLLILCVGNAQISWDRLRTPMTPQGKAVRRWMDGWMNGWWHCVTHLQIWKPSLLCQVIHETLVQVLTVFLWLHRQAQWHCTSGSSWQNQIWGASYIRVQVSSLKTSGSSRLTCSTSTAWTTWRRMNQTCHISLKCMDWVGPASVPSVIAHFL